MTAHPHDLAEQLGASQQAQQLAEAVEQNLPAPLRQGAAADFLRGEALGHALHPMLTDVPMGMWSATTVLDVVGRGRFSRAAQTLTLTGLAAVVPTVASGLAEWDRVPDDDRGTATVHAMANTVATTCYLAAFVARQRRRHALATTASLLGAAAAMAGGYLGGHLSFGRSVGPGARLPAEHPEPAD